MVKSLHVRNAEIIRAVEEGADCLIVGQRRFLLVDVDESSSEEPYDITDQEEIALIDKALRDTRPLLTGEEARAYLQARRHEHAGKTGGGGQ